MKKKGYKVRPLRFIWNPQIGEIIEMPGSKAKIVRIIPYEQVLAEMKSSGVDETEIKEFNKQVRLCVGSLKKYFEVEVEDETGQRRRLDWGEYSELKFEEKEKEWLKEMGIRVRRRRR